MTNGSDDLVIEAAGRNIADKASVYFENIGTDVLQPRIARITGAKIVNRHAASHILKHGQRLTSLLRVAQRMAFGDFKNQLPGFNIVFRQ